MMRPLRNSVKRRPTPPKQLLVPGSAPTCSFIRDELILVNRNLSFTDLFISLFRTTREAYRALTTRSCVDSRPNMIGCTMPIGGAYVHRHRQPDSSKHCHGLVSATTLVRREHVGPPPRHLHARYPLPRKVSRRAGSRDK